MTLRPHRPAGRTGTHLCGLRALRLLPTAVIVAVAGCSSSAPASSLSTTHAVPSAGAYAIATPGPQVLQTPQASDGHYQLVAAGVPVRATLGSETAVVTVSGPDLTLPKGPPATHAPGRLTVVVTVEQGELTVTPSGFLALDQAQNPIPTTSPSGPSTARPGDPARLQLQADFQAGHTTLTWQPTGHPLITWDFVVEID